MPHQISSEMRELSRTTSGRCVRACGETGVTIKASTEGTRTGPPAASEYAVEPVGVEMMTPSAW